MSEPIVLVSIHAPARGATQKAAAGVVDKIMFQSTRPRGARRTRTRACSSQRCFNPRARAGRDVMMATGFPLYLSFNPRARAGRDSRAAVIDSSRDLFQSTRPRGARRR